MSAQAIPGAPRFRGKIGEDQNGSGFYFQIQIWDQSGSKEIAPPLGPYGPYKTEDEASEHLKKAAEIICNTYVEKCGFSRGGYIDLLNNHKYVETIDKRH